MSPLLQISVVSKIYDTGVVTITALDNISLEIEKGDFVSIVGKSGSGKSTLMHIIGLLDTPTRGKMYLAGDDVTKLPEKKLARLRNKEIGFVFQSFNLLQRASVIDNVLLPLRYSKIPKIEWGKKADEILSIVGLTDRKFNKSNELSGGQKQRVAIARALINDPSIILADEPTGNLDTKTGSEILNLFTQLNNSGKTVVIITHDSEIADHAKRKIEIRDGRLVNGVNWNSKKRVIGT